MNKIETHNPQKVNSMTQLVRLVCDCGADMVVLNSGKIICGETARRFENLHRQTIIRDIGRAQACCDCNRSRRKNAGAPSLEPDYETHAKCPECGEPWSKIILPKADVLAPTGEKTPTTKNNV